MATGMSGFWFNHDSPFLAVARGTSFISIVDPSTGNEVFGHDSIGCPPSSCDCSSDIYDGTAWNYRVFLTATAVTTAMETISSVHLVGVATKGNFMFAGRVTLVQGSPRFSFTASQDISSLIDPEAVSLDAGATTVYLVDSHGALWRTPFDPSLSSTVVLTALPGAYTSPYLSFGFSAALWPTAAPHSSLVTAGTSDMLSSVALVLDLDTEHLRSLNGNSTGALAVGVVPGDVPSEFAAAVATSSACLPPCSFVRNHGHESRLHYQHRSCGSHAL